MVEERTIEKQPAVRVLVANKWLPVGEVVGKCPVCDGNILVTKSHYVCNQVYAGTCDFVFFKGCMSCVGKEEIDIEEMQPLLLRKVIFVEDLVRKNGTPFNTGVKLHRVKSKGWGVRFCGKPGASSPNRLVRRKGLPPIF